MSAQDNVLYVDSAYDLPADESDESVVLDVVGCMF